MPFLLEYWNNASDIENEEQDIDRKTRSFDIKRTVILLEAPVVLPKKRVATGFQERTKAGY